MYPPEVYSTKEILNMNRYSDVDSEHLTRLTIGERPNTYTFTKAIAEQLINEERGSLPISIVRPSIVAGAIAEPMPGWVDNVNGPMGLVLSGAHGLCRSACSRIGLIGFYVKCRQEGERGCQLSIILKILWPSLINGPKGQHTNMAS